MSRSQQVLGSIISGIGGLVALFAFLRLPYITKIDFANTSLVPPTIVPGIQLTTQFGIGGGWQALLVGLLAVTAILVAVMQLLRRRTVNGPVVRRAIKVMIFLGLLVLVSSPLAFLISFPHPAYASFFQQTEIYANGAKAIGGASGNAPAYYFGSGFWLYMVGMVLFIVGNVISTHSGPPLRLDQEDSA